MDWIKLDSSFEEDQLKDVFSKVLCAETKRSALCVPGKELPFGTAGEPLPEDAPWTAHTLIRIAKKQSAVFVCDDKVISSRAKPGDYAVQDEADLSRAKVYFVGTEEFSSGMIETHTPIIYRAEHKALGISQDIRLRCAGYFDYRISRPKEFVKYILTQKGKRLTAQALESEMKSIFSVCMPALLAQLSAEDLPYSEICSATDRATAYMRDMLAVAWGSSRGIDLKKFTIVMAEPNRDDENAFLEQCRQAEEASNGPEFDSEQFSAEFNEVMKELGRAAGDALHSFGKEMASLFEGIAEELEKELGSSEEESSADDFDLDSILDGCCTAVMGTWECAELGQRVRFELLYAVIETNGQQVWMGDWDEQEEDDGSYTVVCPTADTLGCYKYFKYYNDGEEHLAGIIFDSDDETQYVRFVRAEDAT